MGEKKFLVADSLGEDELNTTDLLADEDTEGSEKLRERRKKKKKRRKGKSQLERKRERRRARIDSKLTFLLSGPLKISPHLEDPSPPDS